MRQCSGMSPDQALVRQLTSSARGAGGVTHVVEAVWSARVAATLHGRVGPDPHSRGARSGRRVHAYLGRIASRLREGATVDDVAAFLNDGEEVQMGLGDSAIARERNQALAVRLRSWYEESIEAEAQ